LKDNYQPEGDGGEDAKEKNQAMTGLGIIFGAAAIKGNWLKFKWTVLVGKEIFIAYPFNQPNSPQNYSGSSKW
jgi:hypothetical protein